MLRIPLEIFANGELRATVGVGVQSCTDLFLGMHFLFTCSDTFAVGCII